MNITLDFLVFGFLLLYALFSSTFKGIANFSLCLATFLAIIRYIKHPVVFTTDPRLIKAIVLFFLSSSISIFFSGQPIEGIETLCDLILYTFPFILAIGFIKAREQISRLLIAMSVSILIADLYAIWQGLHGNFRADAFSLHPMTLAGYLVQVIPLILVFFIEDQTLSKKYRIFFGVVLVFSVIALLFNGTRGAWIAVILTLLFYGFLNIRRNPKSLFGFLAVILILGIIAFNVPSLKYRINTIGDNNYQSNSERILMWHSAWNMFLDHPITGIGLGNYAKSYQEQYISPEAKERRQNHAHNNFLQILADRGIIGFLGFNYLFGYILFSSYRRYSKINDLWGLAIFLITICLLLQGLTEYNMRNPSVMRMYWFILGLSHSLSVLRADHIELKDR